MREIISGDIRMRIRASTLSTLFYKQEFGGDIVKSVSGIMKEMSSKDGLTAEDMISNMPDSDELLKILWALHKTQNVAEKLQTPHYEDWLAEYQDLAVIDIFMPALEEAIRGFFRISPQGGAGR